MPDDAYYGVHAFRALTNFPISGATLAARPHLIDAPAVVKQAAASANMEVGALPERIGSAIVAAWRKYVPDACTTSSSST